ncbi:MCP methyltransferase, CheR-type [Devosia lucknowensis]|uniref:Chemotaxis protein methyltransferase n=1 Tax=Devosia lucknowensis TaxID=1096929 RepID=A0A1Y6FE84_9HYPH|nr:CheR family methyltransferase [Devosia lucknowensis]SMQ73087.1 MCP methyltransferase, CheR-type [Devosia lucknowensis]
MPALASQITTDVDDHLDMRDFQRIATLIGTEVGIKLPPAKRLMVEGRLRRRLRHLGLATFAEYGDLLFRRDGLEGELPYLINAVTTNKTDFFREPEHFDCMVKTLVPTLIEQRKDRSPLIKVWSAASSTGAEAFTIAMVLADLHAARRDFRFAVLGTDISTDVIETGQRAIYPSEQIAPVPPGMQTRYLMHSRRSGARPEVRIVPELRRHVRFERLNLMDAAYPYDRDVDIIFLRNVLIYFEKADQAKVITRLVGHLRPGGYLLLGHSESMIGTSITMRQVAPAVFQKV